MFSTLGVIYRSKRTTTYFAVNVLFSNNDKNQIPNQSLITLFKNKVFKQVFFFYFQVRQTFD